MKLRSRNTTRIIAVLATITLACHASADSWTRYAGNAWSNAVARRAPRNLETALWSAVPATGEQYIAQSSPVAALGRVFVAARYVQGQTQENRVIAYDSRSGARLWTTTIEPDVFDSWSSPALDLANRTVLVASGLTLRALDLKDGAVLWSAPLDAIVINSSPVVSNDLEEGGIPTNRVFATDFNACGSATLYAINVDPRTATENPYDPGQRVWTVTLPSSGGNSPSYVNGVVYVADAHGNMHAFGAIDGSSIWTTPVFAGGCDFGTGYFGGVTVRAGNIYAASYNFSFGQNNSLLTKIDSSDGAIVWSVNSERTDTNPIVTAAGRIYLSGGVNDAGSPTKLQAFEDLGTSAVLLWETTDPGSSVSNVGGWNHQPVYSRGLLYVGAPDVLQFFGANTDLYVLDVARTPTQNGFVVSHHEGSGGSPAIDGMLYSIGAQGLFAFEAETRLADPPGPYTRPEDGGNEE